MRRSIDLPWAWRSGELPQGDGAFLLPIYSESLRWNIHPNSPPYLLRNSANWAWLYDHLQSSVDRDLIYKENGRPTAMTLRGGRTQSQTQQALRLLATLDCDYTIRIPIQHKDPSRVGAINRDCSELRFFCGPNTKDQAFDPLGMAQLLKLGFAPDYAWHFSTQADLVHNRLEKSLERFNSKMSRDLTLLRSTREVTGDLVGEMVLDYARTNDLSVLVESNFGVPMRAYGSIASRYFGVSAIVPIEGIETQANEKSDLVSLGGYRLATVSSDIQSNDPATPYLRAWSDTAVLPTVDLAQEEAYESRVLAPIDNIVDVWTKLNGAPLEEFNEAPDKVAGAGKRATTEQLLAGLPEIVRRIACYEFEYFDVPHETVALVCLAAVAPQLGARYQVEHYRGSGLMPLNMLVMQVGESGSGKSELTKHVVAKSYEPYALALELDKRERAERLSKKNNARKVLGADTDVFVDDRELILTNCTVEQLGKVMEANRKSGLGVLIHASEAMDWLSSFDAYKAAGKGGTGRANIKTLWDGALTKVQRVNGACYMFADGSISWLCNLTEVELAKLIYQDTKNYGADGFFERMLFCRSGDGGLDDHRQVPADFAETIGGLIHHYAEKMGLLDLSYSPQDARPFIKIPFAESGRSAMIEFLDTCIQQNYKSRTKVLAHLHRIAGLLALLNNRDRVEYSDVHIAYTLLDSGMRILRKTAETYELGGGSNADLEAMFKAYLRSQVTCSLTQLMASVPQLKALGNPKQRRPVFEGWATDLNYRIINRGSTGLSFVRND